jgi:hypothetical protein
MNDRIFHIDRICRGKPESEWRQLFEIIDFTILVQPMLNDGSGQVAVSGPRPLESHEESRMEHSSR